MKVLREATWNSLETEGKLLPSTQHQINWFLLPASSIIELPQWSQECEKCLLAGFGVNNGDNKMTDISQQVIYSKVQDSINNEITHTVNIINSEMEKDVTDQTIKNLSNYFIILSNLNQAMALLKNIKPTQKKEDD